MFCLWMVSTVHENSSFFFERGCVCLFNVLNCFHVFYKVLQFLHWKGRQDYPGTPVVQMRKFWLFGQVFWSPNLVKLLRWLTWGSVLLEVIQGSQLSHPAMFYVSLWCHHWSSGHSGADMSSDGVQWNRKCRGETEQNWQGSQSIAPNRPDWLVTGILTVFIHFGKL